MEQPPGPKPATFPRPDRAPEGWRAGREASKRGSVNCQFAVVVRRALRRQPSACKGFSYLPRVAFSTTPTDSLGYFATPQLAPLAACLPPAALPPAYLPRASGAERYFIHPANLSHYQHLFTVMEQRRHLIAVEPFAPLQKIEFDDKRQPGNFAA